MVFSQKQIPLLWNFREFSNLVTLSKARTWLGSVQNPIQGSKMNVHHVRTKKHYYRKIYSYLCGFLAVINCNTIFLYVNITERRLFHEKLFDIKVAFLLFSCFACFLYKWPYTSEKVNLSKALCCKGILLFTLLWPKNCLIWVCISLLLAFKNLNSVV